MKNKNYDMTQGNIWKKILLFSLPLLGSSLVQQLYNTADLIFVGNFINKQAAAAVGASSLLFICLIGIFTGFSTGVGIVVAKDLGANKFHLAQRTASTAIIFSIIGGISINILGFIFTDKFLFLIKIPNEIIHASSNYLKIYFFSMLPMVLFNVSSGILRAAGNAKIPFYILIIGGILNIIGNFLFIVYLNMGVSGASIATFISQSITAILILVFLFKEKFLINSELKKFKIDFKILKSILHYGLPSGIQIIIMTFSNIIIQYYINLYGGDIVAAYVAYFKLENFLWLPIVAIGQAVTTFTGQNFGALNFSRIKKGIINATLLSVLVVITFSNIILLFPYNFFRIFIKEPEVIKLGINILLITFPFYWLYSILENFGAGLRGMGYSLISMFIGVICMSLLRIFLLFILSKIKIQYNELAFVYPITWLFTSLCYVFTFFICLKRKSIES